MAKIIFLKSTNNPTPLPLTPLMIKTLKLACEWQNRNEPFGQKDLDGSFTALVKREYISCKNVHVSGDIEVTWFVTEAGKKALKKIGINQKC